MTSNKDVESNSSLQTYLSALDDLFNCPHPKNLTDEDKKKLKGQYKLLVDRVDPMLEEKLSDYELWYKICTDSKIYDSIQEFIGYSIHFLIQDQNECSVESVIGDIQKIDSRFRPRLKHETVEKQEFLTKNGPDPLLSKNLRFKALDRMWPEGWHFLVSEMLGRTQSATVTTLLKHAKKENKFAFDL